MRLRCEACGQSHDDHAPDCFFERDTLLPHALALAAGGWPVFALHGKIPYANCQPCKGKRGCRCGHLFCHGFIAATTDPVRLHAMWAMRPDSNIGLRPPAGVFVLDVDPRNAGVLPEGLPETLTAVSGREDGGKHLYFRGVRPGSLGPGIDIKDWGGYVVAPPSIHPDTGLPYRWENAQAIAEWPTDLVLPAHMRAAHGAGSEWMGHLDVGGTWDDVLLPHGWRESADGDWLHPTATSALSARVIDDLLYVFSTSTVFDASSGGSPRGYNRLEAYALLNDTDIMTALKELSA